MLDTDYLFQPRGQGTGWCFRMLTPPALIGKINPRTGKAYGREVRIGLNTRSVSEARKARDILLGSIRQQERDLLGWQGTTEEALQLAQEFSPRNAEEREAVSIGMERVSRSILARRDGPEKAKQWLNVVTGKVTPIRPLAESYLKEHEGKLGKSTLNNLNTALQELYAFGGKELVAETVDRRFVAAFVTDFLPNRKSPRAPGGQGPATIKKKVSQLTQVWRWAMKRGHLPYAKETPWDEQAPSGKEVLAAKAPRRPFTPEELRKLLEAAPMGKPMGDIIRVAVLTGVRLEEVASLEASQVAPDARWYEIRKGKTDNAPRIVPLVGMASEVVLARLQKVPNGAGPLFPELPVRASTGRRGGSISQAFTRLRRDVLGEHTDGELAQHCFRHLWRTAARRAGVDLRTSQEMGGWSRGGSADAIYDHGVEVDHYCGEQEKVLGWLRDRGYL